MGRGTYYHAIILPVSCYAAELERSAREWNRKSRIEALYNSDDLARHMANHVMNQNPALSVTHISTPDLIPRGLWRDPYRIYATLFSQASRVLFLVTESDQDEFEDFFENHLLNFFERLRGHRSFREWNTRFIVVVMGEFELPAILCCENPPCEVVRFHEIGWFRDSVALMLLYQKIRDYWIPPSQTGAHDEKALPHATFEQPSGDFPAVLEETETTQTAITIKNSVSSTIDGVQESSIRQIIREVGEPSDYSESPSDSSISPFNEAAEKADQFVKSSGQEQWHFIAQQTFNMIIEKENRKKYDISNPSGKIACPLCSSAKDYKRRSLEMSKSETHLYRKKNLWPHGGEMQERSEDTSSQSTGYPGISGVFKQSKSPESLKSNSSHLRKPSIFESGDKQLCLSPLERRTTDLNLTSCGSEKMPGDRTFLSEEKTQENKNESEAGEAMKPFSLKPSSPMQCHLPTAPPITERSGCQLMPDTFTQERENVGSASPNLEDVGQNENSLLSKKHDVVKGEQLGSDLPEAFQAMDKYADPKGTKMGPGSTHKSDAVVNSLGQYQAAEGLERGTHEQPKANYLHPQENPHAECPLAYKRSNSTVDEYMTLGKHKTLNRTTDKAEEGSRYWNRAEDMKSYSQKAEVDFRTDIERQEHEHSAESTVHANEHTQDERYPKVHSLEETGLHRQKSMDDKDTESRIAVYAKEEDEQERIKVAVFGSSLSGQSAFLTAEYYPGKQRGLPDMTEENEGEESSKGVGGTMAASISNSGGCGKPSSKPFSDPSHPSDDETMKNFNIMQNLSLEEEQASSSIGAERDLESFAPISLGQLRNGSDAILVNHVSMLSSAILPPNLTSVRKPESGRPDFLQKIIPDNATGSIKSFHKTPEDDIMLEPINEAERKFGETAQFMKKEFGDTSAAVTLTTEFKGSQVHEVIDSKVPQKAVGVRSGSETNDLFSTVEVETETYNEIQKPHLAPRFTFDCRSDEYARVSQSEQLKIELIPQSTPKVYEERKLNLYMLEDPQERPAEESDNYYQSTGLVYLTDEVPRPHLPLELTELHLEDTRSPLNDPELSSPLFSLPSNDEDCIGTDSALRENHYDSDSFSLSELISIENLPVPVLTEQAQISGQPILSGLSTEGELGRQTVEFIKDVEAITMKSSTDEIRPLHGDEIETACLSVALRSPRMSQENKPAQASYNQPSSQKAGLSFAQGNSDISDAEDIPNWNFYTKTDKGELGNIINCSHLLI
ncbi:unnamed protein product [Schistocephalus solidus]|uniref:SEFIR domain-containing protein n=1 Tax=Schistocephalus solidus TaxID=70667 RepID=A0A183TKC7_SCHSO|nr:unnamed protein product [Schistocephalus solidus]